MQTINTKEQKELSLFFIQCQILLIVHGCLPRSAPHHGLQLVQHSASEPRPSVSIGTERSEWRRRKLSGIIPLVRHTAVSPGQISVSVLHLCILVTVPQLTLHASPCLRILRVLVFINPIKSAKSSQFYHVHRGTCGNCLNRESIICLDY